MPAASRSPSRKPETKPDLAMTIEHLRTTNDELQRKRTDAEKDRDLFRDLYNKASTHASEVSKENNALLDRAMLAEGQLRDGLEMVKGMYEDRIQKLEKEVDHWKDLCQVLTTRDARTNDELRRRAALEPELRHQNEQLRSDIEILAHDYEPLDLQENMDTVVEVSQEVKIVSTLTE